MKEYIVTANGEAIFSLKPWEITVLEDSLLSEGLEADCNSRLEFILKHKIQENYKKLRAKGEIDLKKDPSVSHIPLNEEEFVKLITSRPDYKNRSQRDAKGN